MRAEPKREKTIRQIIAQTRLTNLQRFEEEKPVPRLLSWNEAQFFEALEDMTEPQYMDVVKSFPEYNPAEQRPMLRPEQNWGP